LCNYHPTSEFGNAIAVAICRPSCPKLPGTVVQKNSGLGCVSICSLWFTVIHCYAMVCFTELWFALLSYAFLCDLLSYGVLHSASLCFTLLHSASLCFTLLHSASLCFTLLHFTRHSMTPKCLPRSISGHHRSFPVLSIYIVQKSLYCNPILPPKNPFSVILPIFLLNHRPKEV
jgi:hypothetical protein